MQGANPLVEDMPGEIPSMFSIGASASALGATAGFAAGAGYGEDEHQTNLWVAGLILFALLGLIALHITGFRFSTDVGVTRG